MCEILLLWYLGRQIADMAGRKMRNGTWYVLMFVLLWFGGEVAGFMFGLTRPAPEEKQLLIAYFLGLLGAACGAIISFIIVGLLPRAYDENDPLRQRRELDDDDDRPRRRRRRRDEEDDDKGKDRGRRGRWDAPFRGRREL